MKLTLIDIQNFLGARDVRIPLTKPVTIIAGANGAGKSSCRDAIALALTADLGRVSLKKDAGQLVHAGGAKTATITIGTSDGDYSVSIAAGGAIKDGSKGRETALALPYVLDATRFSRLAPDERRTMLFGLMNVRADGAGVRDRLLNRRHDPKRVDLIIPLLRSGFPAAHTEAKSRARDAKAAWKAITGEEWGSTKAEGWNAAVPPSYSDQDPVPGNIAAIQVDIQESQALLDKITGTYSGLQMFAGARQRALENLARHRDTASKFARIQDKLQRDQRELQEWEGKLADLQKTRAIDSAPQCSCPECGAFLEIRAGTTLHLSEPRPSVNVSSYDTAIADATQARDLMKRSVESGIRDLAVAEESAKEVKRLEDESQKHLPDEASMAEMKDQIDQQKKGLENLRAMLAALQETERQRSTADETTRKAAAHHAEVVAWLAIADALAPDGLPAELLDDALGPLNDRLLRSHQDTEWLRAGVESDMTITGDGRPYALLSESERWRVDTMLTEAISHLSGLKLMVLDGADVLDLPARTSLVGWLSDLAYDGEIDSAVVFATLKAPVASTDEIGSVWIEGGVVQAVAQCEVAA